MTERPVADTALLAFVFRAGMRHEGATLAA